MEIMPTPVVPIQEELFDQKGLSVFLKREDLNHPVVSGNKWRKLKYNLETAKKLGHKKLLTFGGAFSNHIYAVAGAGQALNLETIGVIRGEETLPLNYTLASARSMGMTLRYMDRQTYRLKNTEAVIAGLQKEFGDFYLVPEGGTNALALQGVEELVNELDESYDYYCLPVGTGGTMAGVVSALSGRGQVIGFSTLKGDFLHNEVRQLLLDFKGGEYDNWHVNTNYHFGGYAKIKPELLDFMKSFELRHTILLDPVYTAKSLFGLYDLISKDHFSKGARILFIHTGGLQGRKGYGL